MLTAKMTLKWAGKELGGKIENAVRDAVDETLFAASTDAQQNAPRDTGFMASTIGVTKKAAGDTQIRGEFGNEVADYTLWNEIGTGRMAARPFLRPAADREFPKLPGRIAKRVPK